MSHAVDAAKQVDPKREITRRQLLGAISKASEKLRASKDFYVNSRVM